jgi:hypothetical protein
MVFSPGWERLNSLGVEAAEIKAHFGVDLA